MRAVVVTSLDNPSVKFARSLHDRRARQRERAFLVEGPRTIADAVGAGIAPTLLLLDAQRAHDPHWQEVAERARQRGARVLLVTERVLRHVCDTVTPQGMVAVFPIPRSDRPAPGQEPALFLVLDGLQDPGNVGTLLRSALGAGAHAVYLTPGTADPFSPKVVRAAAGSHFRLPILRLDDTHWDEELDRCSQRLAAVPSGGVPYDQVDWTRPSTLMVGSEARGLLDHVRARATGAVTIPLHGGLESLNAAVAGSVLLFEAARQRREARRSG